MVSDYFTKPLQGSLFRLHRNAIMGVSQADYDWYEDQYKEAKKASELLVAKLLAETNTTWVVITLSYMDPSMTM